MPTSLRYERKHNEANGEQNHDGHNENLSWNNGVEGESGGSEKIIGAAAARYRARCSRPCSLSRGTIMLTAGDEFGRTQNGNNNAYAQDNDLTWLDWAGRDQALEEYAFALAAIRKAARRVGADSIPDRRCRRTAYADVAWLTKPAGRSARERMDRPGRRRLTMMLANGNAEGGRLAVMINGDRRGMSFSLPLRDEFRWRLLAGWRNRSRRLAGWTIAGRSVALAIEASRPAVR